MERTNQQPAAFPLSKTGEPTSNSIVLTHPIFQTSLGDISRTSLRAASRELHTSPGALIVEYAKLNLDRAVQMLAHWEDYPVALFRLLRVSHNAAQAIVALREYLDSVGLLRRRPADWDDPFGANQMAVRKEASREAHLLAIRKKQRRKEAHLLAIASALAKKSRLSQQQEGIPVVSSSDTLSSAHAVMHSIDDLSDNRNEAGCPIVTQEVMPKTPSARTVKRRTRRWEVRMEAFNLSTHGVARMLSPNQDLNASHSLSVSPPAVESALIADVSALLAEETFQASGPVPGVLDAENPANEGPRRATHKKLDQELECTAVSAKQTIRNIQATGTGSYRPTFKMLKQIANRKKKRALRGKKPNTESVMRPESPNQDLNASHSPPVSMPVVRLHQTVDVSALLAEETFQASGPVPGVLDSPADAETPADEVPRRATRKRLDQELECSTVSAKQTKRNIQATGTGSFRPTFKMLKRIRQRANRKKKRALKGRNSNTESALRPEIANQGLFASDPPPSPFLHSFGSVPPSLPQTPPVMSSIQTEADSVLLSAPGSNVKTEKEQTFHKRSSNVPQTFHKRSTNVPQMFQHLTGNESKMSEFVPKSAPSKEHISI
jgi:hypothetical protein